MASLTGDISGSVHLPTSITGGTHLLQAYQNGGVVAQTSFNVTAAGASLSVQGTGTGNNTVLQGHTITCSLTGWTGQFAPFIQNGAVLDPQSAFDNGVYRTTTVWVWTISQTAPLGTQTIVCQDINGAEIARASFTVLVNNPPVFGPLTLSLTQPVQGSTTNIQQTQSALVTGMVGNSGTGGGNAIVRLRNYALNGADIAPQQTHPLTQGQTISVAFTIPANATNMVLGTNPVQLEVYKEGAVTADAFRSFTVNVSVTQPPPPPPLPPQITLSNIIVQTGTSTLVHGMNFPAGQTVTVSVDGTSWGGSTSTQLGDWTLALNVPLTGVTAGVYTVHADTATAHAQTTMTVQTGNITPPPPPPIIPPTPPPGGGIDSISIDAPAAGSTINLTNIALSGRATASATRIISKVEVRAETPDRTVGTTYAMATTSDGWAHWSGFIAQSVPAYTTLRARVTYTDGFAIGTSIPIVYNTAVIPPPPPPVVPPTPPPTPPPSPPGTGDTIPPDTTIANVVDGAGMTLSPGQTTQNNVLVISWTTNDNVAVARSEVSIDSAPWVTATSPYTTPALPPGNHTIQIRAVDTSGLVDNTPASFSWMIAGATGGGGGGEIPLPVLVLGGLAIGGGLLWAFTQGTGGKRTVKH